MISAMWKMWAKLRNPVTKTDFTVYFWMDKSKVGKYT